MRKEIGSFYEEQVFNDDDIVNETIFNYLEDNSNRNVSYFSSGREAIEAVIYNVERKKKTGKSCILPLYTCDTVINPFVNHGWKIYFYDIQMDLRVAREQLFDLYEKVKPDVLFMHTYYGCDNISDVRNLIMQWQNNDGLIFIEDLTQSMFLLTYIEDIADYYVGSIRKWFSVPDGGFVLSRTKLKVQIREKNIQFLNAKLAAQKMKYEYLQEKNSDKEAFLQKNREAEAYLYELTDLHTISNESIAILKRNDIQKIINSRNQNARLLIHEIEKMREIGSMIRIEKEAPLYVPILCDSRERLQDFLIKHDIFAPVLWPIPKECEGFLTPNTQHIYEKMLALPCDQRYEISDMKKIVESLIQYDNKFK